MGICETECEVFSPRWGHTDTYRFVFETSKLTINHGPREREAIWSDTMGLQWKGSKTLGDIMTNDGIYPPERVEDLIGYVWSAWRDGQLDDEGVQRELNAFVDYLNASTEAKPKTDFWSGIF